MSGPHSIVDNPSAGAAPGAAGKSYLAFGRNAIVPGGGGTLQLQSAGNSLTGKRVVEPGSMIGLSIQVNVIDAVRDYELQARVNGVTVATLPLPASTLGAEALVGPFAIAAGDRVTAFVVLTAGAGDSTFDDINAQVEVSI